LATLMERGNSDPAFAQLFQSTREELGKVFPDHIIGDLKLTYDLVIRETPPVDNCKTFASTGISIISITSQIQKK